jgi:hypothetical protein
MIPGGRNWLLMFSNATVEKLYKNIVQPLNIHKGVNNIMMISYLHLSQYLKVKYFL